jgi:hypothetical protein
LGLDPYPQAEVDALESRGLLRSDEVVTVYREAVGNYVTWRYGDEALVFVDDRFDFHDLDLLDDHRRLHAGTGAEAILDGREADVVLWQADLALADWLRAAQAWTVAVDGEEWLIACRTGSPAAERCVELDSAVDQAAVRYD